MSEQSRPNLSQVLSELKSEYLINFPQKIAVLRVLTEKKKWKDLREEYHKLKGSGKTYGYPEVSVVCEKLEILAGQRPVSNPLLFTEALQLMEKMHQSYLRNEAFDLEADAFARSLLALKVK